MSHSCRGGRRFNRVLRWCRLRFRGPDVDVAGVGTAYVDPAAVSRVVRDLMENASRRVTKAIARIEEDVWAP